MAGSEPNEPSDFRAPSEFRAWLDANHETAAELLVGFYKRGSGQAGMTWPESVDEALCFGWIDGVRKTVDAERYMIRFTPRRPRGIWSSVNIARVQALIEMEMMRSAGLQAFERRAQERSSIYAYEQSSPPELSEDHERRFRENTAAWAFFQSQPASYRKTAIWGILSAKRDETKEKRLVELINDSAAGKTIARLMRAK